MHNDTKKFGIEYVSSTSQIKESKKGKETDSGLTEKGKNPGWTIREALQAENEKQAKRRRNKRTTAPSNLKGRGQTGWDSAFGGRFLLLVESTCAGLSRCFSFLKLP
ncbi:MAG: hypothetical protein LBR26_05335 [Prevotella sp.]|nr:hypothetical protein [Prevotella sp.]